MATKGAAYFVWAPIATESATADPVYGAGFQLGGLNQIDRSIKYAEAELPADNKVKYKIKQFSSGDLAVKLSEFILANQAAVFGNTYSDGKLSSRDTDEPPMAGVGYINNVGIKDASGKDKTVYRVYINPKTQASKGNTSATSGGSSINLAAEDFAATIYQPEFAEWEIVKEFDTFASAKGYIDSYLRVSASYAVNVQVNNASVGKSAAPAGTTMVASGEDFVLTITGTPTALYDNGVDKVADIAAGTYTVSAIATEHDIAIIF